jgi:uncharacterized protein (DUF4415 family)
MPKNFSPERRAAALAAVEYSKRILTPEEDARLVAAALSDPDNPPLTDEDFAEMRPLAEVVGEEMAGALIAASEERRRRGQRGPGRKAAKVRITVRIDADLAEQYAAGEPGISERVNRALRKAAGR